MHESDGDSNRVPGTSKIMGRTPAQQKTKRRVESLKTLSVASPSGGFIARNCALC